MSPGSLVTCVLGWMVDHVEFGDAVAVVAVLLSLVALYFAARSANASIRSAAATDRSAEASEQSVAVARAARDRAERPQLTITAGEVHEDVCPVTVTMIDGPTMITVSAHYIGETSFAVSDGARDCHFIGGQGDGSYELGQERQLRAPHDVLPRCLVNRRQGDPSVQRGRRGGPGVSSRRAGALELQATTATTAVGMTEPGGRPGRRTPRL